MRLFFAYFWYMRVLIATPIIPPESGGPATYAVALAAALERAGHTVHTIAFSEVRQYRSGVRHLMFLYKTLFAARGVDVVIVLDTVSVALPAVVASWFLGRRVLVRTGGDFVWEQYVERTKEKVRLSAFYSAGRRLSMKERAILWLERHLAFRLADRVVFSTAWQRDIWRAPYGIDDARTAIVANASPDVRPGKRHTGARTAFVWAGRDLVLKNVGSLKDAFARIKERHPMLSLELVSGVPRREVERALRTARCVVVPSVSEVSPNIVLEALAYGVPVVCTADTGIRSDAPPGVLFTDPLDIDALTAALQEMADDASYAAWAARARGTAPVRTYDDVARELAALANA